MTPTVNGYRNAIRVAVGRYERIESTGFTKEALAAIAEAVGGDVDPDGLLPPKSEMRLVIRAHVRGLDAEQSAADRSFRKAELASIADAVDAEV